MLTTASPDDMVRWYETVVPPKARHSHGNYWFLEYPNITLMIDHSPETADARDDLPPRVLINFHVADVRSVERELGRLNWPWESPLEDRAGDLFGTVRDPDGNPVQVIQFGYEGAVP